MGIVMRASRREIWALFLVMTGFCAAVVFLWPIIYKGEIADIRQLKIFIPTSFMFLGLGCGILTRHLFAYLLAAVGVIALIALNII